MFFCITILNSFAYYPKTLLNHLDHPDYPEQPFHPDHLTIQTTQTTRTTQTTLTTLEFSRLDFSWGSTKKLGFLKFFQEFLKFNFLPAARLVNMCCFSKS